MSLLHRINHVLHHTPPKRPGRWHLGLFALVVPILLALASGNPATSAGEEGIPAAPEQASDLSTAVSFPVPERNVVAITTPPPSEGAKVTLPDYIIEPPDILLIESIRIVPKARHLIQAQDILRIVVLGTSPERPIADSYRVSNHGTVSLGPGYGEVAVRGKTTQEAAAAIGQELRKHLRQVEVAVTLASTSQQQTIAGEHLVAPDGTVNLGLYGRVYVAGLTIEKARKAVEKQLEKHFERPTVTLEVYVYNSKFFYVITEREQSQGDQVLRMPVTGNETVLDAVAQVGGLEDSTTQRIWISRPSAGVDQILPVDWRAITRGANTATNYQMLPGDRLFISDQQHDRVPQSIEGTANTFNQLVREGRYDAASRLARRLIQEQPDSAVAQTILQHAELLEENVHYRIQSDVEETADLIEQLKQTKMAENRIRRALRTRVRAAYRNVPLADVASSLGKQLDIDILLDAKGLAAEGITANTKVTLELRQEITVRSLLSFILDPHRLTYEVQAGVLKITSAQISPRKLVVRTYRVKDLLGLPHNASADEDSQISGLDYESLLGLVRATVAPESWTEAGGRGTVEPFPANYALVVSAIPQVHDELSRLLTQIRAAARNHPRAKAF